jgi:hypothetical protein
VAFIAAAGISTFFTIPRLILAVQGGDGAPDFLETAGNAAINIGGKLACPKRGVAKQLNGWSPAECVPSVNGSNSSCCIVRSSI